MLEKQYPDKRLLSVQVLRAFAASAVVVYHAVEAAFRSVSDNSATHLFREFAWLGNFGWMFFS